VPAPVPETKPPKAAPKKSKKKSKPEISVKSTILKAIKNHKEGINTKDLQQQTGLTGKQISNNLFHLKKDKKVEKTEGGLFIAV
jgi:predicted Rossmann fold nucleotide-binding protein DprA/Smf involved in DNA uptake